MIQRAHDLLHEGRCGEGRLLLVLLSRLLLLQSGSRHGA
jgi:hypothetical protein